MAKNKLSDLRDHLFETIERLKDPEEKETMTVEKAQAIADLGAVIVNSAKLEVMAIQMKYKMGDYYPDTGGFIDSEQKPTPLLEDSKGKKKIT